MSWRWIFAVAFALPGFVGILALSSHEDLFWPGLLLAIALPVVWLMASQRKPPNTPGTCS